MPYDGKIKLEMFCPSDADYPAYRASIRLKPFDKNKLSLKFVEVGISPQDALDRLHETLSNAFPTIKDN